MHYEAVYGLSTRYSSTSTRKEGAVPHTRHRGGTVSYCPRRPSPHLWQPPMHSYPEQPPSSCRLRDTSPPGEPPPYHRCISPLGALGSARNRSAGVSVRPDTAQGRLQRHGLPRLPNAPPFPSLLQDALRHRLRRCSAHTVCTRE
eukprot:scaffold538_cov412-Prasinococcus_capsulatus_cf.AAC.13